MNLLSAPTTRPEAFGDLGPTLAALSRRLTASSPLTDRGTAAVEAIATAYVGDALERLGWRWEVGRRFTAWEMMRSLEILPRYDRLVMCLLDRLREDGVVERAGLHWVVTAALHAGRPEALSEAAERDPQGQETVLAVLRACAPAFADVITGGKPALEVLFPGGDSALIGAVYNQHPAARIMNTLVQRAFEHVLSESGRRPARALEAGAGTGGTTTYLTESIARSRCDYLFTDVSSFFLQAARTRFASTPGMTFGTLDLDLPPEDQGFQPHRFDVVIAANMLHACRTVAEALAHVRRVLRPGGVLLLLETTRAMRWLDLVFGLTDGWWAFGDLRLRPDYPLMATARWLDALTSGGFSSALAVENAPASQSLLVCRADP